MMVVASIVHPASTFSGEPWIGCHSATSSRLRVPERWVTLGHGDLRGSWGVREKDNRLEPRGLTVNSRLLGTRMEVRVTRVKAHVGQRGDSDPAGVCRWPLTQPGISEARR